MLNDPRFPNRPQHPDFWSIVDVTNQELHLMSMFLNGFAVGALYERKKHG